MMRRTTTWRRWGPESGTPTFLIPRWVTLDLFALLRSLGERGQRYSFSNLSILLPASPPLLLFDRNLVPRENTLLQSVTHGTAPEVTILLSLSFTIGDDNESDEDDIRTYDVNEKDSEGNSPLLLACRFWKFDIVVVSNGTNVEAVRMDGAGLLSLTIVSQQTELLNLVLTCSPKRLQHQDTMSVSELAAVFLDPVRIEA